MSSNSISGYLSKESKNPNLKRYMYPAMFMAALFTTAKLWKKSRCASMD